MTSERPDPAPASPQGEAPAMASGLLEGRLDSAAGFTLAVRAALDQAIARDVRIIEWADTDFADWPLDDPAFVDGLTRWVRGGRRELVMVAADFEEVRRRFARFARWRADYSHVIRCLCPEAELHARIPALWSDGGGHVIRLFDREQWRGRCGGDRHDRQAAREIFDALKQRASDSFSSTTIGL